MLTLICSVRLSVRTRPFHGRERGSIPLRSTTLPDGVIGNTTGFGPVILGSSPNRITNGELSNWLARLTVNQFLTAWGFESLLPNHY